TYDTANRMLNAIYGEGPSLSTNTGCYNEMVPAYNKNGSITRFVRMGLQNNGRFSLIDNLTMVYKGNQLSSVSDAAGSLTYNGSFDFKDDTSASVEYTYDANGRLTSDSNRGIALIEYDGYDNPRRIQFTNGNVTRYVYSALGEKLRTVHQTAVPNVNVAVGSKQELTPSLTLSADSTDYIGNFIFSNGKLNRLLFNGGYCSFTNENLSSAVFHYYDCDHQGNIRAIVNENGTKEQITHYYPFGGIIADISTNQTLQPYKYNGKELDRMHGLDTYDYGARQYNPILPMWDRMDPLCEKYYNINPYVYCLNNPANAIDPDGRKVVIWYTNRKGERKSFVFTGFHGQKSLKVPKDQFILDFIKSYLYNARNGGGENMIKAVTNNKYNIELRDATLEINKEFTTEYYNDGNAYVFWESRKGLRTSNGGKQSPATRLEHEFDHAIDHLTNPHNHRIRQEQNDEQYENKEERRVITGSEKKTAKANNEDIRYDHYGKTYDVSDPTKVY
ncbi:MAG: RHS repeat-associated core domain-containing protein, partial [Bacteroidota bacterium]|nr:RHS repeat-associated core domain-containing protein [Bacteroidota bacterium]